MRLKALQAKEAYDRHGQQIDWATIDDELSIFGGLTRLINPRRSPDSDNIPTNNPPIYLPASFQIPEIRQQRSAIQTSFPHQSRESGSSSHYSTQGCDTAVGDPRASWDVPAPSYGFATGYSDSGSTYSVNRAEESAMLDDRWSSFVHNYGIMGDFRHPPA